MRIAISKKLIIIFLLIFSILLLSLLVFHRKLNDKPLFVENLQNDSFNGERALEDVYYQVNLGARTPGSEAHDKTVSWIQKEMKNNHWETEVLQFTHNGYELHNVVGKKGSGRPWIILGAHFDSRIYANFDEDPENRVLPVPGANDGASGVAVLIELSRIFNDDFFDKSWAEEIWLVFFDAEDNGEIPGWNWIIGSRNFANTLQEKPDIVIIVDMIGDADLNIYMESNSHDKYTRDIWKVAEELGYNSTFIPETKYTIIDDHIPFIEKGIPSVDIIDFDYPYWHTISDTADKVSAKSLEIVGTTIYTWLTTENTQP